MLFTSAPSNERRFSPQHLGLCIRPSIRLSFEDQRVTPIALAGWFHFFQLSTSLKLFLCKRNPRVLFLLARVGPRFSWAWPPGVWFPSPSCVLQPTWESGCSCWPSFSPSVLRNVARAVGRFDHAATALTSYVVSCAIVTAREADQLIQLLGIFSSPVLISVRVRSVPIICTSSIATPPPPIDHSAVCSLVSM